MKRILVIRGGAIGDFVLTLPALRALRDAYSSAYLEVLGYKHIAALAETTGYADAVRSIEYGPLSSFFARNTELPRELTEHFSSFDLIVSYLYDPDWIFETNLRRAGVQNLIIGPGKLTNSAHAAEQLARPLQELGIYVSDFAPQISPSEPDRDVAREFLHGCARPLVALHPGSGSENKNWPLPGWIQLGNDLLGAKTFAGSLVVVSSEADQAQVGQLQAIWTTNRICFAKNLPLTVLTAILEHVVFLGHDSGISHVAAAAGANCILLFGPTDAKVWAPRNENVRVIQARNRDLRALDIDLVRTALAQELMRIGIST
ncbi:MAG TPA: glycosyltransferase family 9 protein [Chthoniobacterales bacterium]|nr:glycosyltransferase family 9 protein [Chthoniobacterales bacterium]